MFHAVPSANRRLHLYAREPARQRLIWTRSPIFQNCADKEKRGYLVLAGTKSMRIGMTIGCALLLCAVVSLAKVPRFDHVFIVVEENQDFSCVIGNSTMPFLNGLAAKYAVAASYYANSHPSISNYFVLTTGQAIYKGRFGDVRTEHVDVDNVIRQLKQNGKTWRSYAEGVPGPGYMGGNIDSTGYVKRHNPLAYFPKTSRKTASPIIPSSSPIFSTTVTA